MSLLYLLFWTLIFNFKNSILTPILNLLASFLILTLTTMNILHFDTPMSTFFLMNNMTLMLILLTFLLNFFILLIEYKNNSILYFNLMILFCTLFFISENFLIFYISFESSLIPISLIILIHSNTFERFEALLYLLLYTLLGSLPLLFSISLFYLKFSSYHFILPLIISFKPYSHFLFFLMFSLALMIKLPLFFFHSWLPKAHVQAPKTGSMFLAGILLKLGGFGLYRILPLFPSYQLIPTNSYFMSLSFMGSIFTCFLCLQSSDLKYMIALSSVSHMNLLLSSLLTNNAMSSSGVLLMMLSHGLCSSHLFFLSYTPYNRYQSRNMFIISGSNKMLPISMFIWFIFCTFNMSTPPSMNFFSEIFLIMSLLKTNFLFFPLIILLSFFTASFSIFLFSTPYHNKSWIHFSFISFNLKDCLISIAHFMPLILFVMKFNIFSL